MTQRYCKTCDGWHDLDEPWPHEQAKVKRSSLPLPMLILDTMPETMHTMTGQMMTSKSEFRKVTKARGGIEIGNEKLKHDFKEDRITKAEIMKNVKKLKQGYKPNTGANIAGLDNKATF
jgi:hypothetical protein